MDNCNNSSAPLPIPSVLMACEMAGTTMLCLAHTCNRSSELLFSASNSALSSLRCTLTVSGSLGAPAGTTTSKKGLGCFLWREAHSPIPERSVSTTKTAKRASTTQPATTWNDEPDEERAMSKKERVNRTSPKRRRQLGSNQTLFLAVTRSMNASSPEAGVWVAARLLRASEAWTYWRVVLKGG